MRERDKFNFCELKFDHGDFIDRSSIDHKMKFLLIADRSIDARRSDRRLDHDRATLRKESDSHTQVPMGPLNLGGMGQSVNGVQRLDTWISFIG